jgi:hypothetical protein
MLENSWVAAELAASQEGLSSIGLLQKMASAQVELPSWSFRSHDLNKIRKIAYCYLRAANSSSGESNLCWFVIISFYVPFLEPSPLEYLQLKRRSPFTDSEF